MATSHADETTAQVEKHLKGGLFVLDLDDAPIQNYHTLTGFIRNMDRDDRIEMLLTLRHFINAELL